MELKGEIAFELVSQTDEEVITEMPITNGILNPYGVVNAGAIIWFADVTASVLILGNTGPQTGMKGFPLAININANLMGNAREGKFIATSRYVKRGRTVSVVRTVVKDGEKIIAEISSNHVLSV